MQSHFWSWRIRFWIPRGQSSCWGHLPRTFHCGVEFLVLGRWVRGWDFQPSVLDCGQKLVAQDFIKGIKHGSQSSCWGHLPRTFRCGGEFLVLGRWVRGWDFQPSVLDCGQKLVAQDFIEGIKHGSQSSCWGCLPRTFCCGGEFLVLGRQVRGWVFSAISHRLRPETSSIGFYRRHQTWQPE